MYTELVYLVVRTEPVMWSRNIVLRDGSEVAPQMLTAPASHRENEAYSPASSKTRDEDPDSVGSVGF